MQLQVGTYHIGGAFYFTVKLEFQNSTPCFRKRKKLCFFKSKKRKPRFWHFFKVKGTPDQNFGMSKHVTLLNRLEDTLPIILTHI